MNMLVFVGVLWVIYYVLHSVYASQAVKNWFIKNIGWFYPYYRFTYVLFSIVAMLYLIWLQLVIPKTAIIERSIILDVIGYVMLGVGSVFSIYAFKNYSLKEFMGVRQAQKEPAEPTKLVTDGFNGIVRHPLYLSMIILLIGYWFLSFTTEDAVFLGVTIIYVIIGSWFEEKRLVAEFGDEYRQYQAKVYRLIPYIF